MGPPAEAAFAKSSAGPVFFFTVEADDGGTTWRKQSSTNARPMYFSQVRIDPNDTETILYAGVNGHLDDGRDIADEAAMRGNAEAARRATNVAERDHLVSQAARARAAGRSHPGDDRELEGGAAAGAAMGGPCGPHP